MIIVPSLADSPHENQSGIQENKTCIDCHPTHQTADISSESSKIRKANYIPASKSINIQSFEATNVEGNITLVASLGQNWYQQGIKGPDGKFPDGHGSSVNDKSWGWTFFDENPSSGYITPPENVTQRENIYALLLDDGNDSNPITGANVEANVTYWTYDGANYVSRIKLVTLIEDVNHKGFYRGRFDFYGGTSDLFKGNKCIGCHCSIIGITDTPIGYFPGNYSISIRAQANGNIKYTNVDFEVTPWGCEDCHGSGNQHTATADMDSACYLCHGINEITEMGDAGNPHQNTAHINIQCTDCHTNKSLNPQTFNGVTFTGGGLNGNVPQYVSNAIQLNGGTHFAVACTDCHNSLSLPGPHGGFGSYTASGAINSNTANSASLEQFNDYYVINVESSNPLNISLEWDSQANLGFYLYPPDFNPKYGIRPPYYEGATFTNKPEIYINSAPIAGKWILAIYGYDFRNDFPPGNSWGGVLQPSINYTVHSTHPIQRKDLPSTPECNSCHYSGASGGANTIYKIPDWNPGFAHTDTNGDGTLDIQCRLCHNSMHDIGTKLCQNCHTTAPSIHPVHNPYFTQYTQAQCLACHGDPHSVNLTAGTDCIGCHVPNDVNTSKFVRHANLNTTDGGVDNVTNSDCWTCHYQKDMDRSNVYLCGNCHENSSGIVKVTDSALIISDFKHGMTTCKACHAPTPAVLPAPAYHLKGSVGPLGVVEKVLRKNQIP